MNTEEELAAEAQAEDILNDESGETGVEVDVLEGEEGEGVEANSDTTTEKPLEDDEDDGEPLSISLGGDEAEDEDDGTEANSTIKSMRNKLRAEERERKRLQAELDAKNAKPKEVQAELGPEPDIEDFDFDADAYKSALRKWDAQKAKVDAAEAAEAERLEVEKAEWQKRVSVHETKRSELLEHPEYEEAETTVQQTFSPNQNYMAVRALKNAPHVMLALGKHPARLKKLAAIEDPVDFTAAIVREEAAMKVTGKKAERLKPETRVKGQGAKPASSVQKSIDAALEAGDITTARRLRRENGL